MSLSSWLRTLRSASTSRWLRRRQLPATCVHPRRSPSWRTRPRLEQLEDRINPSPISWTGGAGTLNWGTAGNWSGGVVPTSADDVTINISVSGPINIGASAYGVRSLNDTTASLSIASGGSLSLAAVAASSTFGQNVAVQSGGALTVGAGASVTLNPNVTLTDNGTLTFSSGDNVNFASSYGNSEHLNVGGLLTATGTSFYNSGSYYNSQIYVGNGGELQANSCGFSVNNLYLDNGSILNPGDLVNNAFALPLYVPYSEVQNLANNASFQDINILAGTLSSGQLALNAIGTASPPRSALCLRW